MMVAYDGRLGGIEVYVMGSYLLGYIEGNYRGDVGNYSGMGMVIEVDRTSVNACSIRAQCIDIIQRLNNARRALQLWYVGTLGIHHILVPAVFLFPYCFIAICLITCISLFHYRSCLICVLDRSRAAYLLCPSRAHTKCPRGAYQDSRQGC